MVTVTFHMSVTNDQKCTVSILDIWALQYISKDKSNLLIFYWPATSIWVKSDFSMSERLVSKSDELEAIWFPTFPEIVSKLWMVVMKAWVSYWLYYLLNQFILPCRPFPCGASFTIFPLYSPFADFIWLLSKSQIGFKSCKFFNTVLMKSVFILGCW